MSPGGIKRLVRETLTATDAAVPGSRVGAASAPPDMNLVPADTPERLVIARDLFREYADVLGHDLCFQGFAEELASLPGKYAPPAGGLWLALAEEEPAGCVALRSLAPDGCEMKRLFVRPAFRGHGVGRLLAETAIAAARADGYAVMRLDTLATMTPALTLYRSLGFREIPPYYDNPLAEVVYLELVLGDKLPPRTGG